MNKEKLEIIDEILTSYEDWMHGTDGDMCTRARRLLSEVIKDLSAQSLKGEGEKCILYFPDTTTAMNCTNCGKAEHLH